MLDKDKWQFSTSAADCKEAAFKALLNEIVVAAVAVTRIGRPLGTSVVFPSIIADQTPIRPIQHRPTRGKAGKPEMTVTMDARIKDAINVAASMTVPTPLGLEALTRT